MTKFYHDKSGTKGQDIRSAWDMVKHDVLKARRCSAGAVAWAAVASTSFALETNSVALAAAGMALFSLALSHHGTQRVARALREIQAPRP